MSDNKKYYYMRLKENFFDSESMILLESMKNGYLYSCILLKLYCRSLKNDGCLTFSEKIPYNTEMLAKITRMKEKNIKEALKIFQELGLIEILDSGAIYMLNIQEYIGKSSTEADRKRKYREMIQDKKQSNECDKLQTFNGHLSDKHPPEIEIDTDTKIDTDTEASHSAGSVVLGFDDFYNAYPRKTSREKAFRVWQELNPTAETVEKIMKAVEVQRNCEQWKKENGRFIPYPENYLLGRRWEDDTAKPFSLDDYYNAPGNDSII